MHKDGIERIESEMKEQEKGQQKWKQSKGTNWNNLEDGKEEH